MYLLLLGGREKRGIEKEWKKMCDGWERGNGVWDGEEHRSFVDGFTVCRSSANDLSRGPLYNVHVGFVLYPG